MEVEKTADLLIDCIIFVTEKKDISQLLEDRWTSLQPARGKWIASHSKINKACGSSCDIEGVVVRGVKSLEIF